MPYARILETERAGYLVRQYFKTNLYDRISTRPFLEDIEKIWITFQLLKGLEISHSKNIFHGDIKSENVLVTSWNWVYLSDFASFKPVYLPEDDPSQFSLYFDTSQRRACYVAPERFLSTKTDGGNRSDSPSDNNQLTTQMDIFSLGCVIAELFMEGAPTFTLAQLFKYKKREFTPSLDDIDNTHVKEMIKSMISLNPNDRLTASQYLEDFKTRVFPVYFYDFLHCYIDKITRLPILDTFNQNISDATATVTGYDERDRHIESDVRIENIYNNFSTICREFSIEFDAHDANSINPLPTTIFPVCLDLPGLKPWIPKVRNIPMNDNTGCLMIVAMIGSCVRNTVRSESKVKGCELLLALGERIHDEAKLDRCLPLLVTLLEDISENVQISALKCLTQLLSLVSAITPLNAKIFPEYIFPKMSVLLKKGSVLVRIAYASCLPVLADISSKFLDMSQVLKTSGILDEIDPETENGTSTEYTTFDIQKQDLSLTIENHARILLTDLSSQVRRALLRSVIPLCIFLGKQKTNDVILSHAITYLNDKDPLIRIDLFDCIVAIGPFIGSIGLDQYLLPLMIQTLADPEEFVVVKVLEAFTILSDLGLLKPERMWELIVTTSKLMIHPNTWIRNSTFALLASTVKWMTPAQIFCMFLPNISSYIQCDLDDFTETGFLNNVKEPLSRAVYNLMLTWALKAQKSIFWKIDQPDKNIDPTASLSYRLKKTGSKKNISRSSEDERWISRIREIGLKDDQFWMLLVYKDYIYRVATLRAGNENALNENMQMLRIQSLDNAPTNIFFSRKDLRTKPPTSQHSSSNSEHFSTKSTHSRNISATELLASSSTSAHNVKAAPSTSTVVTDIYGELGDSQSSLHFSGPVPSQLSDFRSVSYAGDNPYIWKMLNSTVDDYSEIQIPLEFGPTCEVFLGNVSGMKPANSGSNSRKKRERPLGILVSNFEEHTDAVNCIAVSPDHKFFVTGSDDGTIRIWDSSRLEFNVINRAVLVYHVSADDSEDKVRPQVKCIKFIENTYSMICSLSNGRILFLRVDTTRNEKMPNGLKLRKVYLVKKLQFESSEEYVTTMETVKTTNSLKLYAITTRCRIVVIDLITMKRTSTMINPESHGLVTCMTIDGEKNWIILGTTFGILDLWDIRFELRIKSWGFKQQKPIYQIQVSPKPNNDKLVYVVGGTGLPEVTAWDIEKGTCNEIFRASASLEVKSLYELYDVDRIGKAFELSLEKLSLTDNSSIDEPNVLTCCKAGLGFESSVGPRRGYIITGGSDRMLRFWDLAHPESSTIFNGLNIEVERPYYGVQHTSNLKLVYEKINCHNGNSNRTQASKSDKVPRTTTILLDQQEMNKQHMSTILDVSILLRPFEMFISADRIGNIKVFM